MINMDASPLFASCATTLKETSADTSTRPTTYMTESMLVAVNYDKLKEAYIEALPNKLGTKPRSVDALFLKNPDRQAFIEFKNGSISVQKQHEIHQKVLDSLLILGDIAKVSIADTRADLDFILVYNASKNPTNKKTTPTSVQFSPSRDSIAKRIASRGGETFIQFGLEALKHYCFRNIYTYTETEFEQNFIKTI